MRGWVYEATFSSDTDGSERVVTRNHAANQVSGAQCLDSGRGPRLQLVFKDDETEELEPRLRLLPVDSSQSLAIVIHGTTYRFIF